MTNQEALNRVDILRDQVLQPGLSEALRLASAALGKQIPKRVVREKWTITKCPCCGCDLGEYLEDGYTKEWDHLKVCNCGQQLDWSYPEDDEDD